MLLFLQIYAKQGSKGWLCALRPTSELWTLGCNHRTEILYISDISMILANLGVKPGSIVLETGTGTGSLSTAFISALQPAGRLYTFEYHDERSKGAAVDFDRNGLSPWVTVSHRDTIRTGFPSELDGQGDAVFLDLPAPWEVVANAKKALKHGGMFCSFSPCMEQIQATAEKLYELGFTNIETIECLQKAYDVRNIPTQQDFDSWTIESPLNLFPTENAKKRSRETASLPSAEESAPTEVKKPASNETTETETSSSAPGAPAPSAAAPAAPVRAFTTRGSRNAKPNADPSTFRLTSIPFSEMRGHTGYLIFGRAYKLPRQAPVSRGPTPGPQVTELPETSAKMDTS